RRFGAISMKRWKRRQSSSSCPGQQAIHRLIKNHPRRLVKSLGRVRCPGHRVLLAGGDDERHGYEGEQDQEAEHDQDHHAPAIATACSSHPNYLSQNVRLPRPDLMASLVMTLITAYSRFPAEAPRTFR